MVTIRLTRRGAKNQPFYHVVVTDSRERQGGSSLELVGYFNPVARGKDTRLKLDLDRIDYWIAANRRAAIRSCALAGGQAPARSRPSGRGCLNRYIVLGRIVASFGLRGWVKVLSYTDPPDSLLQHRRWRLRRSGDSAEGSERTVDVLHAQWDGHAMRAALAGIDDRDAAEALREWEILVERAALPAAAEREYYREDLLGFTVRNVQGVVLGTLQYFLTAPATAVMVVQGEREYAVPAEPTYLKRVDLDRRVIEVEWPADF